MWTCFAFRTRVLGPNLRMCSTPPENRTAARVCNMCFQRSGEQSAASYVGGTLLEAQGKGVTAGTAAASTDQPAETSAKLDAVAGQTAVSLEKTNADPADAPATADESAPTVANVSDAQVSDSPGVGEASGAPAVDSQTISEFWPAAAPSPAPIHTPATKRPAQARRKGGADVVQSPFSAHSERSQALLACLADTDSDSNSVASLSNAPKPRKLARTSPQADIAEQAAGIPWEDLSSSLPHVTPQSCLDRRLTSGLKGGRGPVTSVST